MVQKPLPDIKGELNLTSRVVSPTDTCYKAVQTNSCFWRCLLNGAFKLSRIYSALYFKMVNRQIPL